MDPIDQSVRTAAFRFLEEQVRLAGEDGALRRDILLRGFTYQAERVPLLGPQGIFKPRVLPSIPLSITTKPIVEGESRPYDDGFGNDGLLRYRYRGTDPRHHENVGLRQAMQQQVPLIYFHGIVPGLYAAEWPVFIVGDDVSALTFTVSVDDRRFASLGNVDTDTEQAPIRRRYATRVARQRLHQTAFRERVVRAYQHHCAICRLKRDELLDAAHIMPDSDPLGEPAVRNGVALCRLHHAAFDKYLIGIRPDCVIEIRQDLRDETDGPMLLHGLQGFHGARLVVPTRERWRPDPRLLEERYDRFRQALF
jgi:putative restriction endonuclease